MRNSSPVVKNPQFGLQFILLFIAILYINVILLTSYFYDEDLSSFGFLKLFLGCNYLFLLPSLVKFPFKTAADHFFSLIVTWRKQIHDAFSVDHTSSKKSGKSKKKQLQRRTSKFAKEEQCVFTKIKEVPEIPNWEVSVNRLSADLKNNSKLFQTTLQENAAKQDIFSCHPFPVQETGKPGLQIVNHSQNIFGVKESNTCSTQTICLATQHFQTQRKGESFQPKNGKPTCFPQPTPCLEEKKSEKTNSFVNSDVNNPLLQPNFTLKQSVAKSQAISFWPLSFIGNFYTTLTWLVVKFLCKKSSGLTRAEVLGQLEESVEKSNGGGSPTGQSSSTRSDPSPHLASYRVDILPGDPKKEVYRLSTFENFPEFVPIYSFSKYANAGFLYTGVSDILKCFCCENLIKDLTVDIDPYLLKYHRSNCAFTRNPDDVDNIPIHSSTSSTSASIRPRPAGELLMRRQPTYQSASVMAPSAFNLSNSQQPLFYNAANLNINAGSNGHQSTSNSRSSFGGTSSSSHTPPSLIRPSLASSSIAPPSVVPQVYDTPLMRQLANVIDPNHERFLRSLDLCRETERLQTFINWPKTNAPIMGQMAKSGWFYLGNLDRTQCFSCGGVLRNWRRSDNPQTEHMSHFPNCSMVQGTEARNIPILSNASEPQEVPEPQLTESEKHDLKEMFPCKYPASPEMTQMHQRLSTFDVWPYTRATPKIFAEAGLFSLGVRDRVKCHYCGGGLQNFRRNDDPIEEHAKWYPTCEFVLQQKGPAFIHAIVAQFPDLNRPVLRQRGLDVAPPQASHQSTSRTPVETVTPKSKTKSLIEQTMESVIVKTVIEMGFDFSQVKEVIQTRINERGSVYETAAELLDAVLESTNDEEETTMNPSLISPPTYTSLFNTPADIESAEEDIYGSMIMDSEESSDVHRPLTPSGHTSIIDNVMLSTQRNIIDTSMQAIDVADNGMPSNQQANGLLTPEAPASFSEMETSSTSATEVPSHRSFTPRDSPVNVPESNGADSPANLAERLQELKRERTCKVCLDRQADVLFIPCGHICCCLDCTRALRQCPVCRVKIQKAVRTYSRK